MIDVSELIVDPDFCERFTLRRRAGQWVGGVYQSTNADTVVTGVVRPATGDELELLPEGDRVGEILSFYTREMTQLAEDPGCAADEFIRRGRGYKAKHRQDWGKHGFFLTLAAWIGDDDDGDHDAG